MATWPTNETRPHQPDIIIIRIEACMQDNSEENTIDGPHQRCIILHRHHLDAPRLHQYKQEALSSTTLHAGYLRHSPGRHASPTSPRARGLHLPLRLGATPHAGGFVTHPASTLHRPRHGLGGFTYLSA